MEALEGVEHKYYFLVNKYEMEVKKYVPMYKVGVES